MKELLSKNELVVACLNKNTILFHEAEFEALGNRKILFNSGLCPAWDAEPFERWAEGRQCCVLRYTWSFGRGAVFKLSE